MITSILMSALINPPQTTSLRPFFKKIHLNVLSCPGLSCINLFNKYTDHHLYARHYVKNERGKTKKSVGLQRPYCPREQLTPTLV